MKTVAELFWHPTFFISNFSFSNFFSYEKCICNNFSLLIIHSIFVHSTTKLSLFSILSASLFLFSLLRKMLFSIFLSFFFRSVFFLTFFSSLLFLSWFGITQKHFENLQTLKIRSALIRLNLNWKYQFTFSSNPATQNASEHFLPIPIFFCLPLSFFTLSLFSTLFPFLVSLWRNKNKN